jgi:hypothetical protein
MDKKSIRTEYYLGDEIGLDVRVKIEMLQEGNQITHGLVMIQYPILHESFLGYASLMRERNPEIQGNLELKVFKLLNDDASIERYFGDDYPILSELLHGLQSGGKVISIEEAERLKRQIEIDSPRVHVPGRDIE